MPSLQLGVQGITLLHQGTAYGILIGLGVGFCGVILLAVKIQKVYLSEDSGTSEMFMVANRTVGTGLTAAAVFQSWMWINETVFAAALYYRYGLAVPLWWATGLCFQIALMAALGVMAKIRVSYAHTSLEIIRMRYGKIGHVVFVVLNLCCNVFGCASMISSTVSSSMIAASDRRLVRVSHAAVVVHAVFITGVSLAMNYGGANMTWIGYFRPILTCLGIIPLVFALTWSGQTRLAAISLYGTINLTTTSSNLPALYGAIGSMFSPAIYSVLISQYKPYKFDWPEFLRIELLEDVALIETSTSTGSTLGDDEKRDNASDVAITPIPEISSSETSSAKGPEKIQPSTETSTIITTLRKASPTTPKETISLDDIVHPFSEETLKELHHWYKIAWIFWVVIVLVTFVLWPLPLYRDYVFTKSSFEGWTSVAIVWQFFAFGAVVVFPLYDGRHAIIKGGRGCWRAVEGFVGRWVVKSGGM
ncbi:hypothetical protein BDZ45DRAFT_804569 [Acephala macrosclerotiorum]|nr:hypothetical protein BDZ45DRAFT_804569 [Acephala macrosclerotiorum]